MVGLQATSTSLAMTLLMLGVALNSHRSRVTSHNHTRAFDPQQSGLSQYPVSAISASL